MDLRLIRPGRRGNSPGARRRDETGMVTAEFAVVLFAVVIVLVIIVAAVGVSAAHVRTQEAARTGARAAARGDSDAQIVQVVGRTAPGSAVSIERSGADVKVGVSVQVQLPGLGLHLGPMTVRSESIAEQEPS